MKKQQFPRRSLTGSEISACQKRGASWRQRKTLSVNSRPLSKVYEFFSAYFDGRVREVSWLVWFGLVLWHINDC